MRHRLIISDDPTRSHQQGNYFFNAGKFKTAAACFEKCLACEPGIIEVQYYLARCHFYIGNEDIAIRIYNSLRRSKDVEADLCCTLLSRCFDLREGDPMRDVTMLTQEEATAIRCSDDLVLEFPDPFAHLRWVHNTRNYEDIRYQLSIVRWWPDNRWYCNVPGHESILKSLGTRYFEPILYCSPLLFDAHIARLLFFQRMLIDVRDAGKDPWPPTVFETDIPFPQARRLVERVYPELKPKYPTTQLNMFSA
ncbi:MAG: hypothetical protein WBQ23_04445 [Bacteroidota bacterium]